MDNEVLQELQRRGWIGVDLDGTLAHYDEWTSWDTVGPPIPLMVERVRRWLAEGRRVKIFTARIGECYLNGRDRCLVTGKEVTLDMMVGCIQDWTERHVGARLEVTCVKDVGMIELWDDRAVQVVVNTGRTLAEEHASELAALRGAP